MAAQDVLERLAAWREWERTHAKEFDVLERQALHGLAEVLQLTLEEVDRLQRGFTSA